MRERNTHYRDSAFHSLRWTPILGQVGSQIKVKSNVHRILPNLTVFVFSFYQYHIADAVKFAPNRRIAVIDTRPTAALRTNRAERPANRLESADPAIDILRRDQPLGQRIVRIPVKDGHQKNSRATPDQTARC